MRFLRPRRPSAAMLVALAALFIALGGPAQAAKLLDGKHIRKGTVSSRQIKDRSLKAQDLAPATVRALQATPAGSIGDAQLGVNAVTTRALAPASVLSGTVGDESLTAADLAAGSVGADEVADNAIGQPEIRTNGVGAAEIADNTIDGGEIIDNTIDGKDIADGGLSLRDIARQTGSFEWPISDLAGGTCQIATVPISGTDLAGAHVLVSPVTEWPRSLVYTVNGTGSATEFKVQACNRSLPIDIVPAATYTFTYAVLGP